jgi:hypothetical protein
MTALMRSSNWPRYLVPATMSARSSVMTRLSQNFRHIALRDFLRQTFHDGGFAHAGFAEQNGIVLGAAAKNLDDPLDLVFAPDDGVHFALAGDFREVAAKGLERGRFDFTLFLGGGRPFFSPGDRGCSSLLARQSSDPVPSKFPAASAQCPRPDP